MNNFDPQWLDSQYNNRALVPDHANHLVQWAEASEEACEVHPNHRDIAYGDHATEKLDVFPAATTSKASSKASQKSKQGAPVVVFIHGGYWRSLDKSDHSFIAPAFTNQGACVVVPNYALCPTVTLPQIVMQMVKALAWVYKNVQRYGGDPQRITVVGHSAGGHLAALLLACDWPVYGKGLPVDLVKGAVSISGLYDLEPSMHTPFLKDSLRLTAEHVQLASPAWMPRPRQGKLYAFAGADESAEFLRHNRLIQTAWGKKVVPVCETVEGRNHFSVLENLTAPWQRLHQLASQLVFSV